MRAHQSWEKINMLVITAVDYSVSCTEIVIIFFDILNVFLY